MAEAVGVAASAITLAALFSNCIECFSYFKAAQNCPAEAESLLVKLDCEKARLLVWANTVGILQTDPHKRHSKLADIEQDSLIRRCIDQIIALLSDAQNLQNEYGSRTASPPESQRYLAVLSVNSMSIFQSNKRTFFARTGAENTRPGLISRIKWAIRDAAKFRILLMNLREFVDNLIQLVPVSPETINGIIEEDIVSTIDIGTLQLIETGCDEDCYPQWSERASEVIRDSEIGTVDRRNLLEMLRDTEAVPEVSTTSQNLERPTNATYTWVDLSNVFVVLTESCLNVEAESIGLCAESEISKAVRNSAFSASFATDGIWNLARRLQSHLSAPRDLHQQLEQRRTMSLEYTKINSAIMDAEKISRLYVYCGVCVCAIHTAQMLAKSDDVPDHVDVVIRIDDRLTTSCQNPASIVSALEEIRNGIEDASNSRNEYRDYPIQPIDCPALERRIYALEQDHCEQSEPEMLIQNLIRNELGHCNDKILHNAGIVIIAETSVCSLSMQHAPINTQPRMPRAGEMYNFKRSTQDWNRFDMSFIGRFLRSKKWRDRDEKRKNVLNGLNGGGSIAVRPDLGNTPRKRPRSSSLEDE